MKQYVHLNFLIVLTKSKDTHVLVLNSYGHNWKPVMLINPTGGQKELTCFTTESGTAAWTSCSVNWQNRLYIFGGHDPGHIRQISLLKGHKLQRIGSLSFNHRYGACSVLSSRYIFLCFNGISSNDYKRCRRSNGPLKKFSKTSLSNHEHKWTLTSCSESKSDKT